MRLSSIMSTFSIAAMTFALALALACPPCAATLPVITDVMYSDLTDAEVTARDASHSGNDAAALIAAVSRLGGGDPGQWWFSPVRGLGFDADRSERTDAEWNMSTAGMGAGDYQLTITGINAPESQGRDIDISLVHSDGSTLTLISDADAAGTLEFDFTVSAADLHGVDDIRIRVDAIGTENAVIGDNADSGIGRGMITLSTVPEPSALALLSVCGALPLLRRGRRA